MLTKIVARDILKTILMSLMLEIHSEATVEKLRKCCRKVDCWDFFIVKVYIFKIVFLNSEIFNRPFLLLVDRQRKHVIK